MGKKKQGGGQVQSVGTNDQRARGKVNHRDGTKPRGGGRENDDHIPQELIEKAAMLGCEVEQIEEFEARAAMREAGSDEEEDSDLSEESKAAVKPKKAKANMAAANREMPPDSSSEEEGPVTEVIPEEEEKKGESEAEEESSDDDEELERLYGMGKNNNKDQKVVAQAKQGNEAAVPDIDDVDDDDSDEDDEESKQPAQSLTDFLDAGPEELEKAKKKPPKEVVPVVRNAEENKAFDANRKRLEEMKAKRAADAMRREENAKAEEERKTEQETLLKEMKTKAPAKKRKNRMF